MGHFDPKQIRAAVRQMVERTNPNYFLTFSFGHPQKAVRHAVGRHPGWHPIRWENAAERVRDFFDRTRASQELDRGKSKIATAFGFFEGTALNPHYHVVANLQPKIASWVTDQGPDIWRTFSGNGQLHVAESEDPAKVLSYCMKRFTNPKAFETMFIY